MLIMIYIQFSVATESQGSSRGQFKKYITGLGGGETSKIVTNSDKGEGGQVKQ